MSTLLAHAPRVWFQGGIHSWSFGEFLIAIVIIAAAIAIACVAVRAFGLTIPAWLVQIFWIVIVCCVAIFAIRFVLSI